jgi:hypothetical protein
VIDFEGARTYLWTVAGYGAELERLQQAHESPLPIHRLRCSSTSDPFGRLAIRRIWYRSP